nr:hypothetical protein [Treponemataceae bacterium]
MSSKELEVSVEQYKEMESRRKKYHKDRKDGRYIKSMESIMKFMPFVMRTRNDACNLMRDSVELNSITKYVHEKRNAGFDGFNVMYILVAAYVRSVSQNPGVNRFVSGCRIFARNNIEVCMEVKKELKLDAPATMIKFYFEPDFTIDQVYKEMYTKIQAYKNEPEGENNAFDKAADIFCSMPRPFLKWVIRMLYRLDYNGLIPKSLLAISPFHCSMLLTSMGSLGIPPIYHHLYNFGNCPMFISFSSNRHDYIPNKEGEIERKHFLDFNFTLDERICDGQYYAHALHDLKRFLKNPELLEV